VLLLAALTSCKGGAVTPEQALEAFLADVKARNAKGAWAALSNGSQQALLQDAAKLAEAAGTKPETDPARLLFERSELVMLREPESISLASRPGDPVLLRVSVKGGKSGTVRLVREGEAWKVDLFGSLQPFAQTFSAEVPEEGDPEAVPTATASE
jgi:hypothetical protein